MDTLTQRTLTRFLKSVVALEKALALKELPEHAERDSVLLRFELTAELMPKMLQRVLSERGADVALPKDIVRATCSAELIDEAVTETLLSVIDDRNRMVHDYSEEFAGELLARVRSEYIAAFRVLQERLPML